MQISSRFCFSHKSVINSTVTAAKPKSVVGMSGMSQELLVTYSNVLTPIILLFAVMMGSILFMAYMRRRPSSQSIVTVNNPPDATGQTGGFVFIDVADEHKTLFTDAMNGFTDFAKFKGYNVELSLDTSSPGKVGIRFTILDFGVTVSTATVRKDVEEYVERLRTTDDLSNLPMVVNSVEHLRLQSALQARFSYLRTQADMLAFQMDFYRRIAHEWRAGPDRGISYASPVQIHLTNEGWRNMRDSYNAENSQNIAQGRGAKAITEGSTVVIGSTLTEKNKQLGSLRELETAIHQAQLPDDTKQAATRHVQNATEEMEDNARPNPDEVGKWLGRADSALKTAGAAAGLLEKLQGVLGMFGLASG
jgi:hypothetical protein